MLGPHRRNNFSYKTIDSRVRAVLDERAHLDNTQQVAMPFVKATTTVKMPKILGGNSVGFTLGIQMFDKDFRIQDIYSNREGSDLIGYTYELNEQTNKVSTKLIYAERDDLAKETAKFFDLSDELFTDENGFNFIPPPGITSVNIGTQKQGYTKIATINISVPTLSQLEMLHRTFLIPGVGMVLEWGQQFAPKSRNSVGENGLIFSPRTTDTFEENGVTDSDFEQYLFPWYDREKLEILLQRLGRKEVGIDEIYENYVYPTQGQYNWMFGEVSTFNVNSNADGSYDCSVQIVGANENSYAYAVRSTYIPPTIRPTDSICIEDTVSVEGYFNKTVAGAKTFKSLLEGVRDESISELSEWFGHVQYFEQQDNQEGEPEPGEVNEPNVDEELFGDSQDAYFITWRFFVNVVLNDERFGLKSLFKDKKLTQAQLDRVSILRPYRNTLGSDTDTYIVDPYENFVGNNPHLRSTDPSTMIIVNTRASRESYQNFQTIRDSLDAENQDLFLPTYKALEFLISNGDFLASTTRVTEPPASGDDPDRGFLSSGVWINHKAIVQSIVSANTVLQGITSLLNKMNSATMNYWRLAIDDSEPVLEDGEVVNGIKTDYGVVDLNYKESSDYAVKEFLSGEQRVHVFNKYIRNRNGSLIGSDVIDCKVDLKLPKLLFSQIATLGLSQPKDIVEAAAGNTENSPNVVTTPSPDDVLRSMFSVTTLSAAGDLNGDAFDLTQPNIPEILRATEQTSLCGGRNTQTTAGTAGHGQGVGASNASDSNDSEEISRLEESIQQLERAREQLEFCNQNCISEEEVPQIPRVLPEAQGVLEHRRSTRQYIVDTPWSAGFISYVAETSGTPFPSAGSHVTYAQSIRDGLNGTYNGWEVLDPASTPLQRGDIIIKNRGGNTLTFDTPRWAGSSHGDVVTSANGFGVEVIGGNVSDTVKKKTISTTNNVVNETGPRSFFAVLRPPQQFANNIAAIAEREEQVWSSNAWTETTPEAFENINEYYKAGRLNNSLLGPTISTRPVLSVETLFDVQRFACIGCPNARARVNSLERQVERLQRAETVDKRLEQFTKEFAYLNTVFRFIEVFPDWMVSKISNNANGKSSNAFGAAPGSLAISADITLPGIAGLRVGELFWIDRMPAFYKAYGAFTILGMTDQITTSGWTTQINSVFYYLGESWKSSVSTLLRGGTL